MMTTIAKKRTHLTPAESSPAQVPALLTDKQVMDFLGVSRVKLHYMMRKDGLPYIKLGEGRGATLRFSRHSLDEWLAQQEHRASA
jgi:predicted DNA-binding transcriptional regulator AlpA